mgnify:CR=1 FL=1
MKKIIVRGPALSRSGYGEHCRAVLRALKTDDTNDIYLVNVGWGESGWLYEDNEERRWIDDTIFKTAGYLQSKEPKFDLSVQVQLPIEWELLADKNIGVTAGVETDTIPERWAVASEKMDAIIVPSAHTRFGYRNYENLIKKINVIGYPVRKFEKEKLPLPLGTGFNFLSVAQWNPRKNVEQLVAAFVDEFTNEEVGLVLKLGIKNGSNIDRHFTKDRLTALLDELSPERKCKVYLLHGSLTDGEMASLYQHPNIKAYVTTSHGEGFGLPVFESVHNGLPVITSNWGGIQEYSSIGDKVMIKDVAHTVNNVKDHHTWEGVLEKTAKWCYSDTASLRQAMRDVYTNRAPYKKKANKLARHIESVFTEENINQLYMNVFDGVLSNQGENNEVK